MLQFYLSSHERYLVRSILLLALSIKSKP